MANSDQLTWYYTKCYDVADITQTLWSTDDPEKYDFQKCWKTLRETHAHAGGNFSVVFQIVQNKLFRHINCSLPVVVQ